MTQWGHGHVTARPVSNILHMPIPWRVFPAREACTQACVTQGEHEYVTSGPVSNILHRQTLWCYLHSSRSMHTWGMHVGHGSLYQVHAYDSAQRNKQHPAHTKCLASHQLLQKQLSTINRQASFVHKDRPAQARHIARHTFSWTRTSCLPHMPSIGIALTHDCYSCIRASTALTMTHTNESEWAPRWVSRRACANGRFSLSRSPTQCHTLVLGCRR